MTIQEAIKERHMVRKYLEKPIPTEIAAQLQERLTEDNQTSGLRLKPVTATATTGTASVAAVAVTGFLTLEKGGYDCPEGDVSVCVRGQLTR